MRPGWPCALLAALLWLLPSPSASSDPAAPRPDVFIAAGPGLSLGLMHPTEVNDYIQRDLDTAGFEQPAGDIVVSFVPRLVVDLCVSPYAALTALGEVGWSPKLVELPSGENRSYHFTRLSAGALLSGILPLRHDTAVLLGAGALYHFVLIDDFDAGTVGPRFQLGLRWYRDKLAPELWLSYDDVHVRTTDDHGTFIHEMTLDYTSLMLGANVRFLFAL